MGSDQVLGPTQSLQVTIFPESTGCRAASNRRETSLDCVLLLLTCLLVFFAGLGSFGLFDPGDGYFSEAAREMLERGDLITPYLNYQIYFSKPILIYWLIASAYSVFGLNAFAARFWSAVFATLLVLLCYWTLTNIQNRRAGLIGGFVLATAPLVITFARMSLVDMVFSSCLGFALCSTLLTLASERSRWWPAIYMSLGLAVLTKGPAALVIFGVGMISYLVYLKVKRERVSTTISKLHPIAGSVIFCLIALPWYIAVSVATDGMWTRTFILFENLGRFMGHTVIRNPDKWWFYIPVTLYGVGVWSVCLPGTASWSWKLLRNSGENTTLKSSVFLLASWFLAIFLFFSTSKTKVNTYLLPAIPALAMLTGLYLDSLIRNANQRQRTIKLLSNSFLTLGILMLALGAVTCVVTQNSALVLNTLGTSRLTKIISGVLSYTSVSSSVLVVSGLLLSGGLLTGQRFVFSNGLRFSGYLVIAGVLTASSVGAMASFELGYRFLQSDLEYVARGIGSKPGSVAIFREFRPRIIAIVDRPVDSFFDVGKVHKVSEPAGHNQFILTRSEIFQQVFPGEFTVVRQQGPWKLLQTNTLEVERLPTLQVALSKGKKFDCGKYTWGVLPLAGGTR